MEDRSGALTTALARHPQRGTLKDLQAVIQAGFEVMTSAGGGVIEAAYHGAGGDRSFRLNVPLPFDQDLNPFISEHQSRLFQFRCFFTRKLLFLRESDALVVLPGGSGTLHELFEFLTLIQTGRTSPKGP